MRFQIPSRNAYGDIGEDCVTIVGEDTDVRTVCGGTAPAAECLEIIDIQDDDLVFAYQRDMVRFLLGEIKIRKRR